MSIVHALLLIATVTGVLYTLWRVLDLVFSLIEDYHQARAEERAKLKIGERVSGSR